MVKGEWTNVDTIGELRKLLEGLSDDRYIMTYDDGTSGPVRIGFWDDNDDESPIAIMI